MTYRLAWKDTITDTNTIQQADNPLGCKRISLDQRYHLQYVKATGLVQPGDVLQYDTADTTGGSVKDCSAVGQKIAGIGQVQIANGSFGWIYWSGVGISVNVKSGNNAGALLGSSATAGAADAAQPTDENNLVLLATNISGSAALRNCVLR